MNGIGPKPPLLAIDRLSVRLPTGADRPFAVEEVSFALGHSEILCVVGESGSGKSVTAQAVMGLLPSTLAIAGGSIRFAGEDLVGADNATMRSVRGKRIAMIFQEASAALNPVRTIGDQIAEMIRAHENLPAAEVERRVLDRLGEMNLPDPASLQHTYPFRLSGGQQQRVMIAMALAHTPSVLIADEPTTALDVTTQAQILTLIKTLQKQRQMSVLFVTHDIGVVAEIADRIVVMRHGKVVETGPTAQVLHAPNADYTKALIAAVPRLTFRHRDEVRGAVALEATGLNKVFAGQGAGLFRRRPPVVALKDVSFSLKRGETLGVVGESGSGKSTLARCLMRLTPLDTGRFSVGGAAFSELRGRALIAERRRLQMIFQDPYQSLNPRQRVETIVGTPLYARGVPAREARSRTAEMLALVGLEASAIDRYPHEFSGGQRQRIGIARALVTDPDVLIADEAVSSLDVSVQAQVLDLLASIKQRLDLAMIFITHDMRVAAQICDRVMVMRHGLVVEEGETGEVFAHPRHDYTQKLLAAIPGKEWLTEPAAAPAPAGAAP